MTLASDSPPNYRLADVFREITFASNEAFGPHSHHRLEINYVKRGSCQITTATGTQSFNRGDIMVIPSGVNHLFGAGKCGATLIQLEFIPEIFNNISRHTANGNAFLSEHGTTVMAIRSDVRLRSVIQNIIWELHNHEDSYISMVKALYAQLLILLRRAHSYSLKRHTVPPAITSVINIMESATGNEMSVNDIAAAAGITPRYLRRIFRNHFNQSPARYLATMRISKAKEMLANTDLTIKEIAFACGFSSPRQFISTFRRMEGYSPAIIHE